MKMCFHLLSIILLGGCAGALTGYNKPMTGQDEPVAPFPEGMVLIPAGEFEMGSEDAEASEAEQPIHTVYVDAFYMDKYEVTNAEYAVFLNEMGKHRERGRTWYDAGDAAARIALFGGRYEVRVGYEIHPVTAVSWYGAMAYAVWAGKRLPTEAEWEYAARGGLAGQKYPWGNTIDSSKANYNSNDTTSVGRYAANGYELYDMVGNVWEWCLDAYERDFYARSPRDNPFSDGIITDVINNFTNINTFRVLRGGAWYSYARLVRVAHRVW